MALEFPANPVSGQRYTYQDSTWKWNGYAWEKDPYTDINAATGILFGGIITAIPGGTTFNVSAGIGQIIGATASINGFVATKDYIQWDDFIGVTCQNIATENFTYLYIDPEGNLQQQNTPFDYKQYQDDIVIGVVCHIDNSTITLVTNQQNTAYGDPDRLTQLFELFGPMKFDGLVVSAYAADLRLFRSSGKVLKIGVNYFNDQFEPDTIELSAASPARTCRVYKDGAGGFVFDTNGGVFYTSIDPTKYDDGDGTLAIVNNNQWTVQRLYVFPNNPDDIICYYGVQRYNSQSDAIEGIESEVFSEATITRENAVFLGYLIVRGGASNLSVLADAKFIRSGFSRAIGAVGGGGGAGGVGTLALDDLTDVTTTGVTAADILYYSGSQWINKPFNDIPIDGGIY
jgi:hypothetical protein